ncbi:MAG: hypothetical protein K8S56_07490 [Candidatus Cloacimonetes bacterium]|nr:hypothetical protein [Candidatus Cloacimonadota bacterium]
MNDEKYSESIKDAEVLITVRTYPLPLTSHGEVVCTAGILPDGSWVRIYPIRYRTDFNIKLRKWSIIKLDLKRKHKLVNKGDMRPESYVPINDLQPENIVGYLSTDDKWRLRKEYVLSNVTNDLKKAIKKAHDNKQSLCTYKPATITNFTWEKTEPDWKKDWLSAWEQTDFFDQIDSKKMIKKLPYKFFYHFKDIDGSSHRLHIEDWEIGQLFWNCLGSDRNEQIALQKVKQKYWNEFTEKDIHFFLGTTFQFHVRRIPNPYVIIGVFYPPIDEQLTIF